MKRQLVKGSTSQILDIFIRDSSSTTGGGLTGLVFNSASLTCYYHRNTSATATAVSLVTMTVGTFTSSGFKEIDATNMPGWYQLCLPDAAFATGATSVGAHLKGATNMAPLPLEIELTAVDMQDGVRAAMTALPNAAAAASGGLPTLDAALTVNSNVVESGTAQAGGAATITLRSGASATDNLLNGGVVSIFSGTGAGQSRTIIGYVGSTKVATVGRNWVTNPDNTSVYKVHGLAAPRVDDNLAVIIQTGTGTGQLDFTSGIVKSNATQILGTAVSTPATAGILDVNIKNIDNDAASASGTVTFPNATLASTTNITAGTITTVTNLTNAPTSGDLTATMKTSVTTAATAATPVAASVTGAVGSVTGSVGSIATGGIVAASFGAGAIDAAAIATDAIGSAELAASAVTEIQSGLSTHTAADVWAVGTRALTDKAGFSLSSAGIQAIWDALTSALTTVGSVGKLLVDNINATVSSRSSHTAADVWAVATRLLTAGTNIALAKGTGVTGFNDLDAAGVRTAVGLASANLDTQLTTIDDFLDTEVAAIKAKTDLIPASPAAVGSAMTLASGAITAAVIATDAIDADALAADAVTEIQSGLSTITAAGIRTAIGLASANLDTQLTAIDDFLDTEIAAIKAKTDNLPASPANEATLTTIAGYIDTEVAAIKAKTDLIPASPAAVGDIPTATQNADALLNRDMSAVSDTTARSPLNALRFLRNKWSISGSTLTVTEENDTTTAWTATLTTSASADPVTASDPS